MGGMAVAHELHQFVSFPGANTIRKSLLESRLRNVGRRKNLA